METGPADQSGPSKRRGRGGVPQLDFRPLQPIKRDTGMVQPPTLAAAAAEYQPRKTSAATNPTWAEQTVRFGHGTGQILTSFPPPFARHTVSTKIELGASSPITTDASIDSEYSDSGVQLSGTEDDVGAGHLPAAGPAKALLSAEFLGLVDSTLSITNAQAQQQQQPLGLAAPALITDRFAANPANPDSPAPGGSTAAGARGGMPTWAAGPSANTSGTMPQSPKANLAPPPEGIYRTFEDLLNNVQRIARNEGYGVVKLRASNYRDGKPTRYDLVCDRGGVKYASTAKKRNPTTRKVDCPWRAKAVCEVNLQNQWRFQVQEARHNHEARVTMASPGQENTTVAQTFRSLSNKLDRLNHEIAQGFGRMEARLENLEKRFDTFDQGGRGGPGLLGPNGPPMHAANMGPGGMGGPTMGPGGLSNGGIPNGGMGGLGGVDTHRLNNVEARINALEQQQRSMEMPMDEVDSRLLASSVI